MEGACEKGTRSVQSEVPRLHARSRHRPAPQKVEGPFLEGDAGTKKIKVKYALIGTVPVLYLLKVEMAVICQRNRLKMQRRKWA